MKKIIPIILSLVMVFCLSACGGGTKAKNTSTNKPKATQGAKQTNAPDGSEYWGIYETSDGFLAIYDDGTFDVMDFDGEVYNFGVYDCEDGLTLMSEDNEVLFLELDENGDLYGGEDVGILFRTNPGDAPNDAPNYAYGKADFEGYWQYSNGYILQIVDDEWYLYDDGGKLLVFGPAEYEGSEAWLMNEDGSSGGGHLSFDEEGDLIDSGEFLARLDEFPYGNSENDLFADELEGEWYYSDQGGMLYFDGYGSFSWELGDYYDTGTYVFDGEEITFCYDEGGYADASYHDNRIYIEGDAGSWYYRSGEY